MVGQRGEIHVVGQIGWMWVDRLGGFGPVAYSVPHDSFPEWNSWFGGWQEIEQRAGLTHPQEARCYLSLGKDAAVLRREYNGGDYRLGIRVGALVGPAMVLTPNVAATLDPWPGSNLWQFRSDSSFAPELPAVSIISTGPGAGAALAQKAAQPVVRVDTGVHGGGRVDLMDPLAVFLTAMLTEHSLRNEGKPHRVAVVGADEVTSRGLVVAYLDILGSLASQPFTFSTFEADFRAGSQRQPGPGLLFMPIFRPPPTGVSQAIGYAILDPDARPSDRNFLDLVSSTEEGQYGQTDPAFFDAGALLAHAYRNEIPDLARKLNKKDAALVTKQPDRWLAALKREANNAGLTVETAQRSAAGGGRRKPRQTEPTVTGGSEAADPADWEVVRNAIRELRSDAVRPDRHTVDALVAALILKNWLFDNEPAALRNLLHFWMPGDPRKSDNQLPSTRRRPAEEPVVPRAVTTLLRYAHSTGTKPTSADVVQALEEILVRRADPAALAEALGRLVTGPAPEPPPPDGPTFPVVLIYVLVDKLGRAADLDERDVIGLRDDLKHRLEPNTTGRGDDEALGGIGPRAGDRPTSGRSAGVGVLDRLHQRTASLQAGQYTRAAEILADALLDISSRPGDSGVVTTPGPKPTVIVGPTAIVETAHPPDLAAASQPTTRPADFPPDRPVRGVEAQSDLYDVHLASLFKRARNLVNGRVKPGWRRENWVPSVLIDVVQQTVGLVDKDIVPLRHAVFTYLGTEYRDGALATVPAPVDHTATLGPAVRTIIEEATRVTREIETSIHHGSAVELLVHTLERISQVAVGTDSADYREPLNRLAHESAALFTVEPRNLSIETARRHLGELVDRVTKKTKSELANSPGGVPIDFDLITAYAMHDASYAAYMVLSAPTQTGSLYRLVSDNLRRFDIDVNVRRATWDSLYGTGPVGDNEAGSRLDDREGQLFETTLVAPPHGVDHADLELVTTVARLATEVVRTLRRIAQILGSNAVSDDTGAAIDRFESTLHESAEKWCNAIQRQKDDNSQRLWLTLDQTRKKNATLTDSLAIKGRELKDLEHKAADLESRLTSAESERDQARAENVGGTIGGGMLDHIVKLCDYLNNDDVQRIAEMAREAEQAGTQTELMVLDSTVLNFARRAKRPPEPPPGELAAMILHAGKDVRAKNASKGFSSSRDVMEAVVKYRLPDSTKTIEDPGFTDLSESVRQAFLSVGPGSRQRENWQDSYRAIREAPVEFFLAGFLGIIIMAILIAVF